MRCPLFALHPSAPVNPTRHIFPVPKQIKGNLDPARQPCIAGHFTRQPHDRKGQALRTRRIHNALQGQDLRAPVAVPLQDDGPIHQTRPPKPVLPPSGICPPGRNPARGVRKSYTVEARSVIIACSGFKPSSGTGCDGITPCTTAMAVAAKAASAVLVPVAGAM